MLFNETGFEAEIDSWASIKNVTASTTNEVFLLKIYPTHFEIFQTTSYFVSCESNETNSNVT